MLSLFFEVEIKPGRIDQYLNLAASLKPELEAMGGCLFIDRFKSLKRNNLILSYQIWQDEGSMTAWRVQAHHHEVQTLGRDRVFSDYRIRVAQVVYQAKRGQGVWQAETRTLYNDPKRRPPTYVLVTESNSAKLPVACDWPSEAFASVYREGAVCPSGRTARRTTRHRLRAAPVRRALHRLCPDRRGHQGLRHVCSH